MAQSFTPHRKLRTRWEAWLCCLSVLEKVVFGVNMGYLGVQTSVGDMKNPFIVVIQPHEQRNFGPQILVWIVYSKEDNHRLMMLNIVLKSIDFICQL